MNRDVDYIRCELAWETPPQKIADEVGVTVQTLIHGLSINGYHELSVLLADAARSQAKG
jgi:hypothetical protein